MLQRDRRARVVSPNLLLGAHAGRARGERDRTLSHVYALFPVLGERRTQLAGSLSGGEQQIVRDRPCPHGAAAGVDARQADAWAGPVLVAKIFETVRVINGEGVTVLLVEQNASGRLVLQGPARDLLSDARLKRAYLEV